jgi:uncharacterized protein YggE
MKRIIFALVFISISTIVCSQDREEKYIEVIGKSEREVIPDEIYVSVNLRERESGRDRMSLEQQIEQVKAALEELKIENGNLSAVSTEGIYQHVFWSRNGVKTQARFELQLSSYREVAEVLQKFEELNVYYTQVDRVSHSELQSIEDEVRLEAIGKAKEKAANLLERIGGELGDILVVKEVFEEEIQEREIADRYGSMQYIYFNLQKQEETPEEIDFKKISVTQRVYVKFEIQ